MGLRKLCAKLYVNIKIVPKDIRAERRLEPLVSAILVWLNVQIVRKDIKAERRVGLHVHCFQLVNEHEAVRKDIRAERRVGPDVLIIIVKLIHISPQGHQSRKASGTPAGYCRCNTRRRPSPKRHQSRKAGGTSRDRQSPHCPRRPACLTCTPCQTKTGRRAGRQSQAGCLRYSF